MANIKAEKISKSFGDTLALNNVSIDVKDKEFYIVFGPAGAGKTTLLNVIAGLYQPDNGSVFVDDSMINHQEPEDRNISMVFEDYALYPNLTVYENIASPLRSPRYKQPEDKLDEMVRKTAEMLKIDMLLDRNPAELSNGQRQRVGLGRALVRTPNVFLMDEPITHLDAKLRHQMRAELKRMQKDLDTTTIYVTHDYLEALSLGDRIAIINEGKIEQIGTPNEIYYRPYNEFVASSFGEPEINLFEGEITANGNETVGHISHSTQTFKIANEYAEIIKRIGIEKLTVAIRPKDITFSQTRIDDSCIQANVYAFEPLGAKAVLTVEMNKQLYRVSVSSDLQASVGEEVYLQIDVDKAIFFYNQTNLLYL